MGISVDGLGATVGAASAGMGTVIVGNESGCVNTGVAVGRIGSGDNGELVVLGRGAGVPGTWVGSDDVDGTLVGRGAVSAFNFTFAFSELLNAFSSADTEIFLSKVRKPSCCRVIRFTNSCVSGVALVWSESTAASEAST